jgi:hypothetical protein
MLWHSFLALFAECRSGFNSAYTVTRRGMLRAWIALGIGMGLQV